MGSILKISPTQICNELAEYLSKNETQKYPEFLLEDELTEGLTDYVEHKSYNTVFCDILPQFLFFFLLFVLNSSTYTQIGSVSMLEHMIMVSTR